MSSDQPNDPFYKPVTSRPGEAPKTSKDFITSRDGGVLTLHRTGAKDSGLAVDFMGDYQIYKRQKLSPKRDLLAKALALVPGAKVCDLTMGLAQDSFKIAFLGGEVTAVEKNPILVELVKDGLERSLGLQCLKNFKIHEGTLQDFIAQNTVEFASYYLDPMFTHKRSALPKKDMQYLADLVEPCDEEAYRSALETLIARAARVVVKRPRTGEPLCGIPPKYAVEGKMIRFDVYG